MDCDQRGRRNPQAQPSARTLTAVTLYSGQAVTSSPTSEVSTLASASGKWNDMKSWPDATRSVTDAASYTLGETGSGPAVEAWSTMLFPL